MLPWSELSDAEKSICLTDLLLQIREKDLQGELTLCLLCPPGTEVEIEEKWKTLVDTTIASPFNEKLHYQMVSRPNLIRPALYTSIDQETGLLTQYFNTHLQDSGIDTSTLLPITPSLDSLRAFYLTSEILLKPHDRNST